MKRLALSMVAAVGLVGCASVTVPSAVSRDGTHLTPDTERMAIVERQATRFGVKVIWVNPPLKSVSGPG